jgi:hypothetical protein
LLSQEFEDNYKEIELEYIELVEGDKKTKERKGGLKKKKGPFKKVVKFKNSIQFALDNNLLGEDVVKEIEKELI